MFKWNSYRDNAHQKENEIKERKQKKAAIKLKAVIVILLSNINIYKQKQENCEVNLHSLQRSASFQHFCALNTCSRSRKGSSFKGEPSIKSLKLNSIKDLQHFPLQTYPDGSLLSFLVLPGQFTDS